MDNKVEKLKKALIEVRKAHRLVYSFQERMLSLIQFIRMRLGFPNMAGAKHFSNTIHKKNVNGELVLPQGMWAWDFLYSYVFEYHIGYLILKDDSKVELSLVQYADTGYFEVNTDDRLALSDFSSPEQSTSKLLFIMAHTPKGKESTWKDYEYLEEYVVNKNYASSKHKKDVITPDGPEETRWLFYSIPLEQFADEQSALNALKEYLSFLKEEGIELKLV